MEMLGVALGGDAVGDELFGSDIIEATANPIVDQRAGLKVVDQVGKSLPIVVLAAAIKPDVSHRTVFRQQFSQLAFHVIEKRRPTPAARARPANSYSPVLWCHGNRGGACPGSE